MSDIDRNGTEMVQADDCRPLGAFYGIFHGLVLTVLVGGLIACAVLAVTR